MRTSHILEGYGPLDVFLAKQRYKVARWQVKSVDKNDRILDIGCGGYPLFLTIVDFEEKYGLDKNITVGTEENARRDGIILINHNIDDKEILPLEDDFFDVVSMLAVFEHIEPAKLVRVHKEIYRVLKPGGMYVMTTPAFWTDRLLRFLAKLHLISAISISEHKGSYSFSDISPVLRASNFEKEKMRHGYFEIFMNLWVTATK